ncbi:MAG: hypothetical protein TRG1_3208 [Flavobacteriaceae bacterium FS1-H7996/R]|nr:MAG: hypothetical protein TRG1_3208 [Flavobacteriaceae bacterium FS1-H7996/R]
MLFFKGHMDTNDSELAKQSPFYLRVIFKTFVNGDFIKNI